MADQKLGLVESRFADLIWENEPLPSGELVKICLDALSWKKPTTYNVLRKLCDKGIFKNDNGIVSAVISRETFYAMQGETLVNEAFGGSLPAFLAAFTKQRVISPKEAEEIQRMIDAFKE